MLAKRFALALTCLGWYCLVTANPAQPVQQNPPADWREENAYTLGVQAYLFCFPWSYMTEARWTRSEPVDHQANRFDHVRRLEDASHLTGGAPNNDTLYSRAWVDLREPVILTVPEITDRYHSVEMTDFMDDNFAYVGTRATGDKAGNFAIVGPGWKGTLPAGVVRLTPSSTRWAFVLIRTYLKDASELKIATAIQDKYKLTPLSHWGKPAAAVSNAGEIWEPLDRTADPLNEWRTINRSMAEVPPQSQDTDLLQAYARIGIGPGLDVDKQDASTRRGLARAAADGRNLIAAAFAAGYGQSPANGWYYPPRATGRLTPTRDWLMRAVQLLAGFVVNDPIEATYLNVSADGDGKALTGSNRYVIRFAKDGQPKVKAFWSVTMYNAQYNLVANPISRYSLGDRSGMKTGSDGSVTIYIQKEAPGGDKDANWLPAPAGGFFLVLRTYLPAEDIVKQTWQPPSLKRVTQ